MRCTPLLRPLRHLLHRLRQQQGQAVVEFAIVLPVLLMVVLGILYFGRYESYSSQMTQLAEQGARDAAVNFTLPSGYTSLSQYLASQASGEIASGSSNVTPVAVQVDCAGGTSCSSSSTVTVCLQARVAFPGLGTYVGTVYQQATMRVEQTGTSDSTYTPTNGVAPSC